MQSVRRKEPTKIRESEGHENIKTREKSTRDRDSHSGDNTKTENTPNINQQVKP